MYKYLNVFATKTLSSTRFAKARPRQRRRSRHDYVYGIVYNVSSLEEKIFAGRLQAARQLRELSQSELASKAGLQPSAVSHFETGRRSPSFDNLKALSIALEVTTDYLLGRVDQPQLQGETANQLFRHAQKMSQQDLDTLTSFAAMLAKKSN